MKKGCFMKEQIIGILKRHEARCKVPELARESGVSAAMMRVSPAAKGSVCEVARKMLAVPVCGKEVAGAEGGRFDRRRN